MLFWCNVIKSHLSCIWQPLQKSHKCVGTSIRCTDTVLTLLCLGKETGHDIDCATINLIWAWLWCRVYSEFLSGVSGSKYHCLLSDTNELPSLMAWQFRNKICTAALVAVWKRVSSHYSVKDLWNHSNQMHLNSLKGDVWKSRMMINGSSVVTPNHISV